MLFRTLRHPSNLPLLQYVSQLVCVQVLFAFTLLMSWCLWRGAVVSVLTCFLFIHVLVFLNRGVDKNCEEKRNMTIFLVAICKNSWHVYPSKLVWCQLTKHCLWSSKCVCEAWGASLLTQVIRNLNHGPSWRVLIFYTYFSLLCCFFIIFFLLVSLPTLCPQALFFYCQ